MQVPNNSVVLVADGRKSLFFRNRGDAEFLNLSVEDKDVHDNPAHHEQASDTAGRAFTAAGSPRTDSAVSAGAHNRSAYEEVDFHELEENRFAADMAERLKSRALANDYDSLIVVAPPRTLGELRKHYHKEVERRLVGEVPKDLVNVPVDEIERILRSE